VVTDDISRDSYPNDELWCYYSKTSLNFVGLTIEPDIAAALGPYEPPEPNDSLNITGSELTVEMWIKKDPGETAYSTLNKLDSGFNGFYFGAGYLGDDEVLFTVGTGDVHWAQSNVSIDGDWHHIAGTFNAGAHEIFIDGVSVPYRDERDPFPTVIGESSVSLTLGTGGTVNYESFVDEVRVSDVSRSAGWINTSYLNQFNPEDFSRVSSEESVSAEQNYEISLYANWNFVSIPFNESVDKSDIIISFSGSNYTWNSAVSAGIVLDFIYGWNRTNPSYDDSDTLEPGYGYWMWAYHNCELILSSNVNDDGYITSLKSDWNIMGVQYNMSLDKEELIVHYNVTDYT